MLEIKLGKDQWSYYVKRNLDSRFESFKNSVHERDNHTCAFCGFTAEKYMDIINLDGDYRNNKKDNLITSCPLCSQCHFIEYCGKAEIGGGILIYLPEMTQAQLSGLSHVLLCSMANTADYSEKAQNIYNELRLRSKVVEKHLGEGMSDPTYLGQLLVDTPIEESDHMESELLKHLRLLPSIEAFKKQTEVWAKNALQMLNQDLLTGDKYG